MSEQTRRNGLARAPRNFPQWLRRIRLGTMLAVGAFLLIAFFQNVKKHDPYDILFWQARVPRWVALLVATVVGVAAGVWITYLAGKRRS